MTATNMLSFDGDYDFHGTNLDDSTKTVKFYANKPVLAAEAKRMMGGITCGGGREFCKFGCSLWLFLV